MMKGTRGNWRIEEEAVCSRAADLPSGAHEQSFKEENDADAYRTNSTPVWQHAQPPVKLQRRFALYDTRKAYHLRRPSFQGL